MTTFVDKFVLCCSLEKIQIQNTEMYSISFENITLKNA